MQGLGSSIGALVVIALYGVIFGILWKFYRAVARIGEELGDIKELLSQRLPRQEVPPGR